MDEKISMFDGLEEDMIPMFADRLKQMRTQAGLTQQQFAAEIGISVAALSYYETGKRVPDIIFLRKISEYFMIPAEYFLGFTNSTKKENVNISNKLGLSDMAIEKIQRYISDSYEATCYYYENSNILNKLLENDDFYSVLNLLVWTGYECCNYMPDEEYTFFIAMKKMIKVIQETIENAPNLKGRIVESILPDQKEREKYYKWLIEESNKRGSALQEKYAAYKKETEQYIKETIGKFNNTQSTRLEAIENLKEAENNAKHNPEDQ